MSLFIVKNALCFTTFKKALSTINHEYNGGMNKIVKVFVANEAMHSECLEMLRSFNVPFCVEVHIDESEKKEALHFGEKGIFYLSKEGLKISFDWISQWNYHKKANYSLKSEPLARAVGRSKYPRPSVVDQTCGTGKDSLLLLSFGCDVLAFERNPIVFLLLLDALEKAKKETSLAKVLESSFKLFYGSLDTRQLEEGRDWIIYYDPMYPDAPQKRKALPRKEMVVFHEVVGADEDGPSVIESFFTLPVKRVVLKRSLKASVFKTPSASYKGKSTRYDMYVIS